MWLTPCTVRGVVLLPDSAVLTASREFQRVQNGGKAPVFETTEKERMCCLRAEISPLFLSSGQEGQWMSKAGWEELAHLL